jgi:hypothetical protein
LFFWKQGQFGEIGKDDNRDMIVHETLELARAGGVEVRLNAAGDGLLLEADGDPPADLVELLRAAKSELVGRLREQRRLLEAVASARPPDVTSAQWRVAMKGLEVFLTAGHGAEAERLGWTRDELYAVPPLWARVDLCGAALLIGDREVVDITSSAIQIKTASGAMLSFYRKPALDLALVYRERLKLFGEDACKEEVQLRAIEHTVNFCRSNTGCDLATATAAVRAAIAKPKANV